MKISTALCIVALVPIFYSYAFAQTPAPSIRFDVQELRNECKSATASFDATYCLGYVSGILDIMTELGAAGSNPDAGSNVDAAKVFKAFGACGYITYGAAVQAFINWADKHPEKWSAGQSVGVEYAINETWPCR